MKEVKDSSYRSKQAEQGKKLLYQEVVDNTSSNLQPSEYNSYYRNTDDKVDKEGKGLQFAIQQSQGLQATRYTYTEVTYYLSIPFIHKGISQAPRCLSATTIPGTPNIEEPYFIVLIRDPDYN